MMIVKVGGLCKNVRATCRLLCNFMHLPQIRQSYNSFQQVKNSLGFGTDYKDLKYYSSMVVRMLLKASHKYQLCIVQ